MHLSRYWLDHYQFFLKIISTPILLPSKSNVLSQLLVILRWRLAKQVAGWTKPAVRDLE